MVSVSNLAHAEVPEYCFRVLALLGLVGAPMGNTPPGSTGPTSFRKKVIFLEIFEGGGIGDVWSWTCLFCLICLAIAGGDNLKCTSHDGIEPNA